MIGIVLALLAALAYSLAVILVRKKLDESNYFSVALVMTVIGNIILWPLALLVTDLRTVSPEGVLFFAIAGILAPGIARLLYFKGIEVIGISINTPIFSTHPIFSSIFAVLLLGETLAPGNWVGLICISVGIIYLERSLSEPKTRTGRIFKKGLVFPLLAALIAAFAFIVRKHGLNIYNEPLLGVAIGYSLSLLVYVLLSVSSHTTEGSTALVKDFRFFWKAGALQSLGWVLAFYALSHEKVSIVTPLQQTQPLFVLLFAYLYLKELEHISFKPVMSTLFIVMGVMLVSIR